MSTAIPTGNTIEVAIDRLRRAGNFASNGVYMIENVGKDAPTTLDTYIRAAQAMLDEARTALESVPR